MAAHAPRGMKTAPLAGIGRSMAFVAIHIALDKLRNLKPIDRGGAREAVDMYGGLIALRK